MSKVERVKELLKELTLCRCAYCQPKHDEVLAIVAGTENAEVCEYCNGNKYLEYYPSPTQPARRVVCGWCLGTGRKTIHTGE